MPNQLRHGTVKRTITTVEYPWYKRNILKGTRVTSVCEGDQASLFTKATVEFTIDEDPSPKRVYGIPIDKDNIVWDSDAQKQAIKKSAECETCIHKETCKWRLTMEYIYENMQKATLDDTPFKLIMTCNHYIEEPLKSNNNEEWIDRNN